MEDNYTTSITTKIIAAIFVLVFLDLIFINWWVLKKSYLTEKGATPSEAGKVVASSPSPSPKLDNLSRDNKDVEIEADVSPTPSPTTVVSKSEEKVVVQNQYKEIFIPVGSGQTKNTSFVDIDGAEVSIDTNKYGQIDYAVFEGSVWVEGGNGRAWAQIVNVSDNNPLIESQISNPTSTPTLKTSSKIPLASGSKTYRIQARTELSDYAAHIDNGRLKIVLK